MSDILTEVRGAIEQFNFRKISLGKCRDSGKDYKIIVTPVLVKAGQRCKVVFSEQRRDVTKTLSPSETFALIGEHFGTSHFTLTLVKDTETVSAELSKAKKLFLSRTANTQSAPVSVEHNRSKNYLIPESAPWLYSLGIASRAGKILPDGYDKFRQINKFCEIVLAELNTTSTKPISVVDLGSGKSYLTFALHHLLGSQTLNAEIVGVEQRPELVTQCNAVVSELRLKGLNFIQGEIKSFPLRACDLLVALHACDTATDDAIAWGIRSGASVMVLAPCCHKYVRRSLKLPPTLNAALHHGILKERFAESVTDGLRALTLAAYGYESKVFEFIDKSHTAKNTMIVARASTPDAKAKADIEAIKTELRIGDYYLDKVLL